MHYDIGWDLVMVVENWNMELQLCYVKYNEPKSLTFWYEKITKYGPVGKSPKI